MSHPPTKWRLYIRQWFFLVHWGWATTYKAMPVFETNLYWVHYSKNSICCVLSSQWSSEKRFETRKIPLIGRYRSVHEIEENRKDDKLRFIKLERGAYSGPQKVTSFIIFLSPTVTAKNIMSLTKPTLCPPT